MNMFGLGVVINATDNMSKGFMTALNTLNDFEERIERVASATQSGISEVEVNMMRMNNLALTGMGLQEVGSQISGVGQAMLSPFIQFGQQITSTGSQFENYRLTLKALYGDIDVASSKINEAMDLAAKTPFQLEDVMDSVVGFKALGVEVLDTMEDVTGESRTLLEYIGDLASLRPDVGLEGMLYGIRNLLGGDGGRSLRSRLDMDFEQMLGFEWADTTEGMIEQIVMASQEIANGLMKEMEGSWGHMTSNLEDQWDKFKLSVADSGAFDSVKNTLKYFYEIVEEIDDEKMDRIGKNISSAFNMLWKPIDLVARSLSNAFRWVTNLIAESPILTKVLTGFTAISGTVLILVGAMTMLGGSVLIAYAGFKGLQLLFTKLPTFIVTMLPKLATAMTMFGKFALVAGSLYLAWKSDFLGVRTVLQNFMNNVATAFSESSRISQLGVDDMLSALKQLDTTTFGGWLTYRLTQLKVFWVALCDAWNDYTLSDENFQKVQALGLLPLLETILDLKLKSEAFFEGFKEGFKKVSDFIVPIVQTIGEWVGKLWNYLFPVNDEIKEFNENGEALDLKPWQDLGETLAYVVTGIGGLLALSKVVSVISTIGSAIGKAFSFIGRIPSILGKVAGLFNKFVLMPILTTIGTVVTSILGFFGLVVSLPAWAVGLITLAVIGIVALIVTKWDEIKEATRNMLNTVKEWFTEKWGAIKDWYNSTIVPWVDEVKSKWESFKEKFCEVVDNVKQWFVDKFDAMKKWYDDTIQPWIDAIKSGWESFKSTVVDVATSIKDWFTDRINQIKEWYDTTITPWIESIKNAWESFKTKVFDVVSSVKEAFVNKINQIKEWYNTNIQPWVDTISSMWESFKTKFSEVITDCKDWFIETWDKLKNWYLNNIHPWVVLIAKVFEVAIGLVILCVYEFYKFFKEKWNDLKSWYNTTIVPWVENIKTWWTELKLKLINIVTDVRDWFINKWGEIVSWYNTTVVPWIDGIKQMWEDFKTKFTTVLTNIKDWFLTKWGELVDWYNTTVVVWIDNIKQIWEDFKTSFFTLVENIKNWFITKWNEAVEWYNSTILPWIETIKQVWQEFKTKLVNIITDVKDWFISKWGELKEWYNSTIQPWIDNIKLWWDDVKTHVVNAIGNIKDSFLEKWGAIKQWYEDNISPWVTKVRNVWSEFSEKVSKVWENISSAWKSTIGSLYTWVAEKINSMIKLVNNVPFVNIGYVDTQLPGMPEPKVGLATGGFVKDEGVAMLHPNEVVINDDLTRKLRMFLNENETENPQGRSLGLNNNIYNNNYINNTNNTSEEAKVDVSPITNVLTRFVDNVSNFFSNPLNITMPEFNYPVPTVFTTDDSDDVETPVSYNTTNNEETDNSNIVYNNLTNTLANTTNKNTNTNVSNDYSVTFDKGAIQIIVENGNDSDVEKIAQQIMLKIKRQQQLDKTRNYKPSF